MTPRETLDWYRERFGQAAERRLERALAAAQARSHMPAQRKHAERYAAALALAHDEQEGKES